MTHFRFIGIAVFLVSTISCISTALSAAELPDDSVYHLDVSLENHRGESMPFSGLQGHVTIASMFYGSCPHVCPMLIGTIRQLENRLPAEARTKLQVAVITVDPEGDTPEHLNEIADRHGVDNDRWVLARTTPGDTRPLAAVLGIKYKALPAGGFNHTSAMILLDARGVEIARSGRLGVSDPEFVAAVHALLMGSGNGT